MRLDAILHIPMSEYCHGMDEEHIVYRLRCARGDLKEVTLFYGDTACRVTPIIFTPVTMEIVASDKQHDYWEAVVDSPYNRVYYYFQISDGVETKLYYGDVFTNHQVDDRSQYFKLPFNHRDDIATVPEWVKDAVVYNIFPDSFATEKEFISKQSTDMDYGGQKVHGKLGGTLKGVAQNVEYLKDLGINCVYLNPIFVAGEYHKYDLLDYFHIDPCFGGDEAFKNMVDVLHENGIRVIIDGVFNHCGWNFFAFQDVIENQEKSKYCKWFYHLQFPVERPKTSEEYPTYSCFAYERMMPKMDTSNPEVRDYFCKVGEYWIKEFHIDGWRLDVASEANDDFWRGFRKAVKRANPDALIIGEVWETAKHWLQGDMFDSTMNYDFRKHCELFFATREMDAEEFAGRITDMRMRYRKQFIPAQLNLLDSHDVSRFLSLCDGDISRYKLAIIFMMTFVGMPTIFYGDEQGICGVTEEEYRQPMPWENRNKELYDFFQNIIALRNKYESLRRGDFRIRKANPKSHLLSYERITEKERVIVALNSGINEEMLSFSTGNVIWSHGFQNEWLMSGGFVIIRCENI